jgi:hypothetical protein
MTARAASVAKPWPQKRHTDPITELRSAIGPRNAAAAYQRVIEGDQEGDLTVPPVDRGDELFGIFHAIGVRNARGVHRDATIVDKARQLLSVVGARRAQHQPFGLEDRKGSLSPAGATDFFREGHDVGSCNKPKGGAGIPVSPFSEPIRVRRFDWIPAELV